MEVMIEIKKLLNEKTLEVIIAFITVSILYQQLKISRKEKDQVLMVKRHDYVNEVINILKLLSIYKVALESKQRNETILQEWLDNERGHVKNNEKFVYKWDSGGFNNTNSIHFNLCLLYDEMHHLNEKGKMLLNIDGYSRTPLVKVELMLADLAKDIYDESNNAIQDWSRIIKSFGTIIKEITKFRIVYDKSISERNMFVNRGTVYKLIVFIPNVIIRFISSFIYALIGLFFSFLCVKRNLIRFKDNIVEYTADLWSVFILFKPKQKK